MYNHRIFVKEVKYLNHEGSEASILFELNNQSFTAFCHPCDLKEGETVEIEFDFIEQNISDEVFWNGNPTNNKEIEAFNDAKWSYYCYSEIINIQPLTVDCGKIIFAFDRFLNDSSSFGKFVYFVIARLDISRLSN